MIIYNHKKEFIGIDEKDLRALKLSSLAELQNEAVDFADLFVKTPGYIHNFKHVHWLDFIGSADSIDENKVIISVKGRNFKATVDLRTLYLVDAPSKPAYGVVFSGIRELTKEENERISGDLVQRSVVRPVDAVEPVDIVSSQTAPVEPESFEETSYEEPVVAKEESVVPPVKEVIEDPYAVTRDEVQEQEEIPLDLGDELFETPQEESELSLELPQEEQSPYEPEESISLDIEPQSTESAVVIDEDDKFKDYRYDPELASNELGLPVDLVEEFIQDFIAQAYEFKPELYEALDNGRMDSVRMNSHKLKGVAANLRIEDAYDALVTINTSDDVDEVKRTLDRFYNYILKKLAGEDVTVQSSASSQKEEASEQEESLELDLDEISLESPSEEEIAQVSQNAPVDKSGESDVQNDENDVQEEEEKLDLLLDDDEELELSIAEDEPQEEPQASDMAEESQKVELDLDDELELEIKDEEEPATVPDSSEEHIAIAEEEGYAVDKGQLASELGIDPQTYTELLEDYLTDVSVGLDQLNESISLQDEDSMKKLAIRLKGMSDNMRLKEIASLFEKLASDADANKEAIVEEIRNKIDSIKKVG